MSCLYILEINPLSFVSFAIIFFHIEGCLFTLLVGRFGVFFLSHTAPGFQLWFYFHLCIWVVHLSLLLRLSWRTCVCPSEGPVWRWCSFLGCRDSGSTRYSGIWWLGHSALEGYGNQYWPICSSILAWRTPLPDREAWQATVHMVSKSWTQLKQSCMYRCKIFFAFGSSAPVKVKRKGSTAACVKQTLMVPSVQGHGLSQLQELWPYQSFFKPLVAGDQKASLASFSP